MTRKQCEQSAAAMNPLVRWKRFHIWSGGKNEVKWWNIDYVSSSNRRRLPERITNEKFMFIIHKPAAYASTVSIYHQYCSILQNLHILFCNYLPWPIPWLRKNAGYEWKSHEELTIKALPENTHALAVSLDYQHYVAIMLDFLFAVLNCPSRITNPR